MPEEKHELNTILIARITPYFLERGALWFEEHEAAIRKKAKSDPWWRDRILVVERDARLRYSPFMRMLIELGYGKVGEVMRPGQFAVRGNILDVWPINLTYSLRLEFIGNTVARIFVLRQTAPSRVPKISLPKNPSDYERLWLRDLSPGDYVVHADHGIGVFRGIAAKNTMTMTDDYDTNSHSHGYRHSHGQEFYTLEYAPPRKGGLPDRLLVPRNQAPKLSRYLGFETPTIHRLGGIIWARTKRRAREGATKFAEELVVIYRERAKARRPAYPAFPDIEAALEHTFEHEETQDQTRAIEEVHRDLSSEKPMDRLIVGDVGFGKTEVAIRAAARAAFAGKQVLLLTPTTILADQHLATFRRRLQNFPVEIFMLSRLTSRREVRPVLAGIAMGTADIVIGTHRLLSPDVRWKNLGLVIIDEEQRFGVRHKEKLKSLRAEIDILSLSATPIPRTLSLALTNFRDLSVIQTPPAGRIPIKTFVLPHSRSFVREAIGAELKRGGQVFYLWNRIETIEHVRKDLDELVRVPTTIAVLHGRMDETELLAAMDDFRAGKIKILVATTIIENGLDLPQVNTLIVANAARLGLAQAYQLRGRIGRADKQSFAYFLYPTRRLTEKAKLRLDALQNAAGLGSGFQIALRDLEFRGAGNVLGKQQSGTMNRVGLNLYAQLLNEALEELEEK